MTKKAVRSTSDAVASFFTTVGDAPKLPWLDSYMQSLAREPVWTAGQLTEVRRAILKWMED